MIGNFISCAGFVLRQEGGYNVTTGDAGLATNFGISQTAFPSLNIATLTVYDALKIYADSYWNKINGDNLPIGVDMAIYDAAVNMGVGSATKRLQGLLSLVQDGDIGPVTLAAIAKSTPSGLIVQFCYSREAAYRQMAGFAEFGAGWIARAQRCQTMALAMVAVG